MGNPEEAKMDRVSDEVAMLSNKVVALERSVQGGIRAEDKEFVVLIELLMIQMLKLYEIEAEGEFQVQRKRESNDIFECLLTCLSCPKLCGVVGRIEGEKPRHEPECNLAGFAFGKVRKSVLCFSSKELNNHNTKVGTV